MENSRLGRLVAKASALAIIAPGESKAQIKSNKNDLFGHGLGEPPVIYYA